MTGRKDPPMSEAMPPLFEDENALAWATYKAAAAYVQQRDTDANWAALTNAVEAARSSIDRATPPVLRAVWRAAAVLTEDGSDANCSTLRGVLDAARAIVGEPR